MYQVLARKWRPQSFDTLVGQKHVSRTLRNAITSDRLAHAYIFSGLRGTGKTSVARILAKCLNCESGPTPDPCNKCVPCTEITAGRAIDVIEIDAASRTQVEKTREFLETLSYAPARDRYKVAIIDEVHMLSRHSFNALLKTLEEPPERVVFVLATTELHKILPTILSRCQVFEFRRATSAELVAHLRRIATDESIEISDASLERIARAGEGSIRDTLSVLERVLAFCGTEVSDDDVLTALGAVRTDVLVRWVGGMAARDASAMLGVLDEILEEGRDLLHLWSETVGVLRDLLVLRTVENRPGLIARSPEDVEALAAAAEPLSLEDLSRAFQILSELEYGLKGSAQPRFLFEAALIRLASLGAVRPIESFLESLGRTDPGHLGGSGAPGGGGTPPARGGATGGGRPTPPARRGRPPAGTKGSGFRADFEAAVQGRKPLLGGILAHAIDIRHDDEGVEIRFGSDGDLWLPKLEREDFRVALTESAREALGRDATVRASRDEDSTPPSTGGNGDASARTPRSPRKHPRQELMDSARSDPGVERLLREFGAQVVDIRPLEDTNTGGPDGADPMETDP